MTRVTFDINLASLASVTDDHLAALWHIAQANPATHGDREACELVKVIGIEIIRRWLAAVPPALHIHQADDHYWKTLHQNGLWNGPGGAWVPHQGTTEGGGA
jgi:hypothetical protein